MFKLLKILLGFHCHNWSKWEKKQRTYEYYRHDFSDLEAYEFELIPKEMLNQTLEHTNTWQERICKTCGKIQKSKLR